jgi:hypothetical protein
MVTDKYVKETLEKIRKTDERMRKLVGNLEKEFVKTGRKIDDMFIPRLEGEFGAMGFVFDRSAERAVFGNREYPSCYAGIDVFLGDRDRTVAVKSRPYFDGGKCGEAVADRPGLREANIDDMREHVERMKKLRRHFELTGDFRKLYGVVAVAVFPADVLGFALDQGFYVIEYAGEHIGVRKPEQLAGNR